MKKLIFCFLIVFTAFSCEKDKDKDPDIEMVSVTAISNATVKLTANVKEKGSYEILDYGFVYSLSNYNLTIENGSKISLGKDIQNNSFSKEISLSGLSIEGDVYFRSYIVNSKGVVYSNSFKFTIVPSLVNDIYPNYGQAGDTIMIYGSNFKSSDNIIVKFNESVAKLVTISDQNISVIVPNDIIVEESYWDPTIYITVKINGSQKSQTNFTLMPTITSFYPLHGSFGTTITLKGSSFYNVSVYMDDVRVSTNSTTTKTIKFDVPTNISSIKSRISIQKNGREIFAPGEFVMDSMKIKEIYPQKGVAGGIFSISGSNFNTSYGNKITVGGINTYCNNQTNSLLQVVIPSSLTEGTYDIEIDNGVYKKTLVSGFKIVKPVVMDFTPKTGSYGTLVTFAAHDLYMSNGYSPNIYFGGQYANVISWDTSKIEAYVPWSTAEGEVVIQYNVGNNNQELSEKFTITPPSITSFSPASGSAGTVVTITGEGFPSDNWSTIAKFGTVNAPVLSCSNNKITVQVPTDAPEGAMKISLTFYSVKTFTTSTDFTVTKTKK